MWATILTALKYETISLVLKSFHTTENDEDVGGSNIVRSAGSCQAGEEFWWGSRTLQEQQNGELCCSCCNYWGECKLKVIVMLQCDSTVLFLFSVIWYFTFMVNSKSQFQLSLQRLFFPLKCVYFTHSQVCYFFVLDHFYIVFRYDICLWFSAHCVQYFAWRCVG